MSGKGEDILDISQTSTQSQIFAKGVSFNILSLHLLISVCLNQVIHPILDMSDVDDALDTTLTKIKEVIIEYVEASRVQASSRDDGRVVDDGDDSASDSSSKGSDIDEESEESSVGRSK